MLIEVHPFKDGNSRVARAIMNKFLVEGNQPKIIVLSVARDDYVTSLKGVSLNKWFGSFISQLYKYRVFGHYLSNNNISNRTVEDKIKNFNGFKSDMEHFRFEFDKKDYLSKAFPKKDKGLSY